MKIKPGIIKATGGAVSNKPPGVKKQPAWVKKIDAKSVKRRIEKVEESQ